MGYGGAIASLLNTGLSAFGMGAQVAGGNQQVAGIRQQGNAAVILGQEQQTAKDYEAAQLKQQAGQVNASGSQEVANNTRATNIILSNARAAAAGSGGSVSSPSVLSVLGNISARGEYNSLSDLYGTGEKAAGMVTQANLDTYEGSNDYQAGLIKNQALQNQANTTALSNVATFASKYGGTAINGIGKGVDAVTNWYKSTQTPSAILNRADTSGIVDSMGTTGGGFT